MCTLYIAARKPTTFVCRNLSVSAQTMCCALRRHRLNRPQTARLRFVTSKLPAPATSCWHTGQMYCSDYYTATWVQCKSSICTRTRNGIRERYLGPTTPGRSCNVSTYSSSMCVCTGEAAAVDAGKPRSDPQPSHVLRLHSARERYIEQTYQFG